MAIIGSGFYSYWYGQRDLLEISDGKKITLNYQKVAEVGPGYFVVQAKKRDIKVMGDIKGIKPGDIISFSGIFQKGGTLKLHDYYISKYRALKYAVSVLATFLSFLWFFANFRINWKKLVLVKREPCQIS